MSQKCISRARPLIMVVDDDVTARMFAREQLEKEGFDVEEVASSCEAIEAYNRYLPDVVLLDVMMPNIDGFTICEELRRIPSATNIPIMMMTVLEDEASIQRAYEAGATEFTSKPVSWPVEVHRVRYLLQSADAMREVSHAKELWEQTFNSIDEIVAIMDTEQHIVMANEAMQRSVHMTREELGRKRCFEVFQNRTSPCPNCPVLKTRADGLPWSAEIEYLRLGATVLVSSSPIFDESGTLTRLVYTAKDMSERKQIEEQVHHAKKMEAVGTLAGGISHDFNNLLQTILGNTELLLMDMDEQVNGYEDMRQVIRAAKRGSELTRRLLTLTLGHCVQGQRSITRINDHVIQVEKLLVQTLPKNIQIRLDLKEGMSNIFANPGQVEQVLMNLAENAVDAMHEGGMLIIETHEVELDGRHDWPRAGRYVQVCVSDTGNGMSKETLSHIFDPFFTTKRPDKGTGLGLSVSYGIMRHHEGQITCYSEVGMGTSFNLYFPAVESRCEEQRNVVDSGSAKSFRGDETILVVEDDPAVRQLAKKILKRTGYTVVDAFDGIHALEVYERRKADIDLVILDIMMPNMDGIECLRALIKQNPSLKVLIASGYSPNLSRSQALENGAIEFVPKPYQTADLLGILRKVLE